VRIAGVTVEITGRKEAQLAEMRRRILQGQELERTQLAHEIHDGPMQELAAFTFELGAVQAVRRWWTRKRATRKRRTAAS
jgi:signal transduction histidine kinase